MTNTKEFWHGYVPLAIRTKAHRISLANRKRKERVENKQREQDIQKILNEPEEPPFRRFYKPKPRRTELVHLFHHEVGE